MVTKWPIFSMFHPKTPGVSLILFSYMLSEMKSVEKPYSPKYGHGGLDFDHTTNIPGHSKYFHSKISDVLNNKIEISFDRKELFSYFFRQILTFSGH